MVKVLWDCLTGSGSPYIRSADFGNPNLESRPVKGFWATSDARCHTFSGQINGTLTLMEYC